MTRKKAKITKQQFEEAYAQRSGVTVEWLREQGREARPCDCGDAICEGWQMVYVKEEEWFAARMRELEVTE